MQPLPELNRIGRKLAEERTGLESNEQVLAVIKFKNAMAVVGVFTAAAWALDVASSALERAMTGPTFASLVGRYRDGVMALTSQRLLFYTRKSLHKPGTFAYKPVVAFLTSDVEAITKKGKGILTNAVEIRFTDGSLYEFEADSPRARSHLFAVIDALPAPR